VNQFVESSIGDASILNPILYQDGASGDIVGYIFNGLIKYNQDQDLIGDLAENWDLRQRSLVRLDPKAGLTAEAARARLEESLAPEIRERMKLRSVEAVDEYMLALVFDNAGRGYENEFFEIIPKDALVPVHFVHVLLSGEEIEGWPKALTPACRKKIEESVAPSYPGRILDYHQQSSQHLVIKFLGDEKEFVEELKKLVAPVGSGEEETKVGEVERVVTYPIDNEQTVVFHIRQGVRWHDGEPFSAWDAKFTYDKLMDEKTNTVRRSDYELIRRVEVPDARTFVVIYREPFSPCLESWGMGMLPKHLLEGVDINEAKFNRHPIGTGPYIFKEWRSDEKITLVANPDYYEGRPFIDQISYRVIPETAMSEMEFSGGNIDYYGPSPHQVERFRKDPRYVLYSRLSNGYTYIGWNINRELFQDVRVRRALTMAVDREAITKYVLFDEGVLANGPFPPQMWYSNHDVKPLPYDPEAAKKLLAEAGWKDTDGDGWLDRNDKRFEFTLMTNQGNDVRESICALVYDQLKKIGIKVSIEVYEWSVFIGKKIDKRDYDACVLGWGLGYDPDVYSIWHSSQRKKGFNFNGYKNEEVDRLLELGRTEFDREERRKIYFRIHELINDDQPYTFLFVGRGTVALPADRFTILKRPGRGGYEIDEIEMTKIGLRYYFNDWVCKDRIRYEAEEPRPPIPEIDAPKVVPEKEDPAEESPSGKPEEGG